MAGLVHEFTDQQGSFWLSKWRTYITSTISHISPQASGICPFGFELLSDASFLARDLRRYYVYVSEPQMKGEEIFEKFMLCLQGDAPNFCESIGFLVHPTGRLDRDVAKNRLLHFQVLKRKQSILEIYSRYVVACPDVVLNGTLTEMRAFDISESARRYVFQLTLMVAAVFPEVTQLTEAETSGLALSILEMSRTHISQATVTRPPRREEAAILAGVVLPFMRRVRQYVQETRASGGVVPYEFVDIHSDVRLAGTMNAAVMAEKMELIRNLYSSYPPRVSSGR
ncbi:hypothetical protein [Streptomyces sp. NBC_01451]|uniref:hypothetical protein n=1 Tax=Streptomyces sp. NBC_01451 TaxID=2903872 RepID=UPI002E3250AC|nr:hypothetical protein [Streptomyces sp. NBC_01451]